MWEIWFASGYHDYIYPEMEPVVLHLLQSHDITYEDMDVVVSTQPMVDYDIHMHRCMGDHEFVCIKTHSKCVFGAVFESEMQITDTTSDIYIKVLPL